MRPVLSFCRKKPIASIVLQADQQGATINSCLIVLSVEGIADKKAHFRQLWLSLSNVRQPSLRPSLSITDVHACPLRILGLRCSPALLHAGSHAKSVCSCDVPCALPRHASYVTPGSSHKVLYASKSILLEAGTLDSEAVLSKTS